MWGNANVANQAAKVNWIATSGIAQRAGLLGHDGPDRLSFASLERSSDRRFQFFLVVHPKYRENRGVDVSDCGGVAEIIERLIPIELRCGSRFAVHRTPANPTSGQQRGETVGPVVASTRRIYLWRTTELASAHHHSGIEQVSLFQTLEK